MSDQIDSGPNKKRSFKMFFAQDIASKLRSKEDFYTALDKHGKCFSIFT